IIQSNRVGVRTPKTRMPDLHDTRANSPDSPAYSICPLRRQRTFRSFQDRGRRLSSEPLVFKLIQSNSNRFKPKNVKAIRPARPGADLHKIWPTLPEPISLASIPTQPQNCRAD